MPSGDRRIGERATLPDPGRRIGDHDSRKPGLLDTDKFIRPTGQRGNVQGVDPADPYAADPRAHNRATVIFPEPKAPSGVTPCPECSESQIRIWAIPAVEFNPTTRIITKIICPLLRVRVCFKDECSKISSMGGRVRNDGTAGLGALSFTVAGTPYRGSSFATDHLHRETRCETNCHTMDFAYPFDHANDDSWGYDGLNLFVTTNCYRNHYSLAIAANALASQSVTLRMYWASLVGVKTVDQLQGLAETEDYAQFVGSSGFTLSALRSFVACCLALPGGDIGYMATIPDPVSGANDRALLRPPFWTGLHAQVFPAGVFGTTVVGIAGVLSGAQMSGYVDFDACAGRCVPSNGTPPDSFWQWNAASQGTAHIDGAPGLLVNEADEFAYYEIFLDCPPVGAC